jgi:nitrogen fixation/metabolism regulation signal transduction histidine kinase
MLLGLCCALTWEVFRFVSKTNQEITRFLEAARYADFGQRFNLGRMGAGFGELGDTFTEILERFRESRGIQEEELRHLKALLEHVPVPLLSIYDDEHVTLWNNTARRLFGSKRVVRLEDLDAYGDDLAEKLRSVQAGERRLVTLKIDEQERRITIAASQIVIAGRTERLVSLQDIQSELDGIQIEAWQDLVRVLTHEIMNSITPVASLAKTTVDLVEDAATKVDQDAPLHSELEDVRDAVDTVARRSDSLINFVSSYRRLTRLPPPEKSTFLLSDLFGSVASLAAAEWPDKGLELETAVEPEQLDLYADRGMIEQILINLLQNSQQALGDSGKVRMRARLNKRGHVCIDVSDNGPGIPGDIRQKIFVPFFTTKREGSGVGLALARQIMIAHGGSITVAENDLGGACFSMNF